MHSILVRFDPAAAPVQPPRTMRRLGALAVVALAVAAGCTTTNTNPTGVVPDQAFSLAAATSGANEIAAGKAAQQKATDPSVRAYAAQMVQDHTNANAQMKAILSTKGVSVTEAPDAEHVAILAKMSSMSGAEFDRAYMQQQVVDHQKTIALFDAETRNGSDPDVRSFASTTLPIIQQHLMMAQQYTSRGTMGGMSGMSDTSTSTSR